MAKRGGREVMPVAPTVPAAAVTAPSPEDDRKPWQSRDVDSLAGETLRAYARRIGVRRSDCEALSEDRLRQNCKLFIANYFEMISGD